MAADSTVKSQIFKLYFVMNVFYADFDNFARMKSAWIKYFPVVFGLMLFTGCKNGGSSAADDSNPIFKTDPGLKVLTEQIHKSPKDAALFFERGNLLHKLQRDTLALKDYKTAAAMDTTKAEYFSTIGDMLFEHKDISGSVEWIEKAIRKNPEDRKAHLKIAKLFLYLKTPERAFSEINIVLRKNPYDPEAYFLKGMIYKDLKDTSKAISSFQTAVQVAPEYREAVIQLGLMYSAKKNPLAIQYLDNAYKMDTTDVFPIYARGVYFQNNNEYAKAKEEYRKCIMRDRHYADAYFNMGYMLMQEDSTEKAWRQYDIVTKIDPLNPTAYYNRGLCSEMMAKVKEAVADYKQAIYLDSAYASPKDALRRLVKK